MGSCGGELLVLPWYSKWWGGDRVLVIFSLHHGIIWGGMGVIQQCAPGSTLVLYAVGCWPCENRNPGSILVTHDVACGIMLR